jgi:hypothetical protein
VRIRWELEDRQPGPAGDQLEHCPADVGVQALPYQNDRSAELLVRGI